MCILELQVVIGWSLAFREEANFSLFCFDEFIKAHNNGAIFSQWSFDMQKALHPYATIMSLSILSLRYKSIELSPGHVK